MHFPLISVTLFYFLPSLRLFGFLPGQQTLDFPLYMGCIISPKCVLESHDNCISWNVLVCVCISVHYFWLFFLFVSYVCRAAVVPELTGQKTTPNSPKAGQTRAAPTVPFSPRDP